MAQGPQDARFPAIAPLADGGEAERPLWSVMIPTFNRTPFLEETLRSVLDQVDATGAAFGAAQMQIEVVDNASTQGDAESIVRRVGGGRVSFARNERNLGMAGNWNRCIERARGRWVHVLHDDDALRPGFYAAYQALIESHQNLEPPLGLVFSRQITIDEESSWKYLMWPAPGLKWTGVLPDAHWRLATENVQHYLRCPSVVVAREAYQAVGGFDTASVFSTDWLMWLRVAAKYSVGYVHEPLSLYREHAKSETDRLKGRHDLARDIARTLAISAELFPPERRAEARERARSMAVEFALFFRMQMHGAGHDEAGLKYARSAFGIHPTRATGIALLKSVARRQGSRLRRQWKRAGAPS